MEKESLRRARSRQRGGSHGDAPHLLIRFQRIGEGVATRRCWWAGRTLDVVV